MEATKVSKTHVFKDSQGEHVVTNGKLLLVRCTEQINNDRLYIKEVTNFGTKQSGYIPFIIAYKEEPIFVNDSVLFVFNNIENKILTVTLIEGDIITAKYTNGNSIGVHKDNLIKILVKPNNLSKKHIQSIVNGKLRDGDEVYVECTIDKQDVNFVQTVYGNSATLNTKYVVKIENYVARLFKSPSANIIQALKIQEKASIGNWKVGLKWAFSENVMGQEIVEVSTDKGDDGLGEWIAKVRGNTKEQAIANAKLIASAPLVLRALLSAKHELEFMYNQHQSVTTKKELEKIESTLKNITD